MMACHPKILHFSGHGLSSKIKTENREDNTKIFKEFENKLIFEREDGAAFVFEDELIKKASELRSLDLVFLAACQSEKFGDKMLQSGAKHVICAKHASNLDDIIAVKFAKLFYENLFAHKQSHDSDKKSICEIFHQTKDEMIVQFKDKTSEINKLIIKPDYIKGKNE